MPILLLAIIVAVLALSGYRETSAAEVTALKLETQAFKGDWEAILARGTIRVAVPYSRTLFFNDRGTQAAMKDALIILFDLIAPLVVGLYLIFNLLG